MAVKAGKNIKSDKLSYNDAEIKEIIRALSPLQLKFANHYLSGMTSKEAYKAAGYSVKGGDKVVWANSQTLLQSQAVRAYIEANKQSIAEEFAIDRHQFANELKRAFLGEWKEETVVMVNNGDYTSSPKIIKRGISTRDRLKAAEILERVFMIINEGSGNTQTAEDDPITKSIKESIGK